MVQSTSVGASRRAAMKSTISPMRCSRTAATFSASRRSSSGSDASSMLEAATAREDNGALAIRPGAAP